MLLFKADITRDKCAQTILRKIYESEIKCEDMARNKLWWAVSGGAYFQHHNVGPRFVPQDISWSVK